MVEARLVGDSSLSELDLELLTIGSALVILGTSVAGLGVGSVRLLFVDLLFNVEKS